MRQGNEARKTTLRRQVTFIQARRGDSDQAERVQDMKEGYEGYAGYEGGFIFEGTLWGSDTGRFSQAGLFRVIFS